MSNREQIPWIKHIEAIEKHLGKNEKWLQTPERKIQNFETEMDTWNKSFLKHIGLVEKWIGELEKKMEE